MWFNVFTWLKAESENNRGPQGSLMMKRFMYYLIATAVSPEIVIVDFQNT